MVMQKHSTHKNAKGFTLIELLIVIAIIGILAAIAIPQFNQYKIRGYDTSAKQALRDVTLLCNAYWIDNDCSEECSLPKIMAAAYGFNQSSDLDVTLPSPSSQCSNFCASAKSNSSPNTYSIDSASLISEGGGCSSLAQEEADEEGERTEYVRRTYRASGRGFVPVEGDIEGRCTNCSGEYSYVPIKKEGEECRYVGESPCDPKGWSKNCGCPHIACRQRGTTLVGDNHLEVGVEGLYCNYLYQVDDAGSEADRSCATTAEEKCK